MQDILDALAFSSRELTEFQERVGKLQADTDILIAGTKESIAASQRLMRRIDREAAIPRPADEPSPASSSPPQSIDAE